MPALDTNVLVRYFVQDDASQLAVAQRLISRCVDEGAMMVVPVTVVLDLEWVLRSSLEFSKDEVLMTLSSLFSAAELTFEPERARSRAAAVPRGLGGLRRLPSRRVGHSGRRATAVDLRQGRCQGQRCPTAGQGVSPRFPWAEPNLIGHGSSRKGDSSEVFSRGSVCRHPTVRRPRSTRCRGQST